MPATADICCCILWSRNALGRPFIKAQCTRLPGHAGGHWDEIKGRGWAPSGTLDAFTSGVGPGLVYQPFPAEEHHEGTVTTTDDPAHALLADPNVSSSKPEGVHDDNCYICRDPEFAQMGLPLCRPCPECQRHGKPGHVPADDCVCSVCGFDEEEHMAEEQARLQAEEGRING